MEYNNYYPGQSSPNLSNHQHTGRHMQSQQPQQLPQAPSSMHMHASLPAQNVRQTMNSGSTNQHQQMQHQIIGQHPQQMTPQQHHAHYHQIQRPHSHEPPVPHSSHGQHQSDQNLQPNLIGPSPQSAVQSQQHHVHPQSPYHHTGPHMHIQQPQPQPQHQQLNHMVRSTSSLGPSVMSHPHIGIQQPVHSHQNYFSGQMGQSSSVHQYPQQNHHHTMPPSQNPQPSMMQQPPLVSPQQMVQERVSPFYPGILQTESRVIELNRRLQSRPMQRYPISPLPNVGDPYDEGTWWERFASDFFEDDATLTLRMQEEKPTEFTIGRTLIPKFFRTYFDGGVTDLSINLRNPKETCTHPHIITLDCDQTFIVTSNVYKHPAASSNQSVVVHTEGRLVLEFVNNIDVLSIKSWKFYTRCCREYIDRSVLAQGLPNSFLVEPITRQGLTKSTVSYLKMCMIMEPMQDIIVLNKHTNLNPRTCMQKLLADKYKFSSTDGESRTTTTNNNKRRKRKPPAAPASSGPTTARKSKTNNTTNGGRNSNLLISPSSSSSFSVQSKDALVVEPTVISGDFGEDSGRVSSGSIQPQDQIGPTSAEGSNQSQIQDSNHQSSDQQHRQTLLLPQQQPDVSPQQQKQQQQTQQQQSPQQRSQQQQQQQAKSQNTNQLPQKDKQQESPKQQRQPQEPLQPSQPVDFLDKGNGNSDLNPENGHHSKSKDEELTVQPSSNSQPTQLENQANFLNGEETSDKTEVTISDQKSTVEKTANEIKKEKQPNPSLPAEKADAEELSQKQLSEHQVTVNSGKQDSSDKDDTVESDTPKQSEIALEEIPRPTSEDSVGKENNGSVLNVEVQTNSIATQSENQFNIMNSIPEDREDICKPESIVSKLPPSSNTKSLALQNGSSNKQNRRRSSERKQTVIEGLMRTSEFVVAIKDLKCEHPALWRITTGNNLLQQFEPKTQNGIVLYENTNQYAGWNHEIKRDYVGVDVRLTQHTRNQITVEKILLNFKKLDNVEAFYDKHFVIYLQILISTALDPKFWEGIESEPEHHDYFVTSRKIIDDIIKRYKSDLSDRLKKQNENFTDAARIGLLKNFEKYPSFMVKPINENEKERICRACNTNPSTQVVTFENKSYDLHSYKPVKVTSELTKTDDRHIHNNLCDTCLNIVRSYSEIHHMSWKFFGLAREKVELHRARGKPINTILDECLKDEEWLSKMYAERDALWSRIERVQ